MFCSKCGTQIAASSTFCSNCGSPTALGKASTANEPFSFVANQNTPAPAPMSGLAIAALILSLTFSVVGLILGYMAQNEIRESNGAKSGEDLAKASIVIGWIFTILGALVGLFIVIAAVNSSSYY